MRFTNFLVASALAALASAQTFTTCDPTKKDCPNDPAMAATFNTDFKAGADKITGWKQTAGALKYTSEGAEFTIAKKGDSPTIQSESNLFFGTVEVTAKASVGQGIISSIVLESADLDEVDWEWIGVEQSTVQLNYFGKGNTTTYDRMIRANVASPMTTFHTYKLDWTAERIIFSIDGAAVRTLNYGDANGGKNFPQTPSNVRIGIWAGGDSDSPGTVEWAGGKTDYSKAPFTMVVSEVKITNASPGKEYKWTDRSGSYQSIEVVGKGDTDGAPQNSLTLGASASASGTGGGVGSGIDAPTQTGVAPASSQVAHSTGNCTEGTHAPTTTAAAQSTSAHTNGTAPCSCGVETVIITGYPPSSTAVPSTTAKASSTGVPSYPAVPVSSAVSSSVAVPSSSTVPSSVVVPPSSAQPSTTLVISTASPLKSSSVSVPPAVTVPASSAPPYPTTTGLVTDTHPAPSVSGHPTGGYPVNGTQPTSTLSQFTGGASYPTAVPLAGLAAAALLFI
ncbi:glycoside hydrolase family 16 protein [Lophiostoma macrostomum CBS 122681]|uniref:chitinase n=1 Tax=Lophiostoma macrostomum CBS 122681 TaxID=1314788 RepID=A0A6A6TKH9_9PLEO|nr:glycoside hydrolase family 16 protein [Lophiostoma macrostomum CBS 122681]